MHVSVILVRSWRLVLLARRAAEDVSGAKRSASVLDSKNIAVKGYKLGPEDLLSISAEERLEILNRVKEGKMSVDDAVSEVVEHKKRQNCVIC